MKKISTEKTIKTIKNKYGRHLYILRSKTYIIFNKAITEFWVFTNFEGTRETIMPIGSTDRGLNKRSAIRKFFELWEEERNNKGINKKSVIIIHKEEDYFFPEERNKKAKKLNRELRVQLTKEKKRNIKLTKAVTKLERKGNKDGTTI